MFHSVTLPWPPSVNHYWRAFSGRLILSQTGRRYREAVVDALRDRIAMGNYPMRGALSVQIVLHRPDRRRRDVDNVVKALLDALTHAGLWEDDSQVASLVVTMSPSLGPLERRGTVDISVSEYAGA